MKKKIWLSFLGICVLSFGIFAINYTKPMTISELSQGVELSEYQYIEGRFNIAPSFESVSFKTQTQEDLNAVFELFDNQTFRKSLTNLLPENSGSSRIVEDGEFQWEITFQTDEIITLGENGVVGGLLTVTNFYGELEIRFDGESYTSTTDNQEEWLEDVLNLISGLELS